MKHPFILVATTLTLVLAFLAPSDALAVCKGGAPDGLCEPPDDDCACDDCLAACSGECTPSNPPACTLEDSCTCSECWTDEVCTDPDKANCKDDGTCEFFTEGCCCADCAALENCTGFNGSCGTGGGGTGGTGGGTGGSTGGTGGGTTGGSSASTGGTGGAGGLVTQPGGCGCTAVGVSANRDGDAGDRGSSIPASGLALTSVALGLATLSRRRRRGATSSRGSRAA